MNNFAKSFALGLTTVLALPVFALVGLNAPALALSTIHGYDFQFKTGLPHQQPTVKGNFNPSAVLDTTQVKAGKTQGHKERTFFCFTAKTDSGWDCFTYENIPTTDYYQSDDHLVWAGPAKEIQSQYDRLNQGA